MLNGILLVSDRITSLDLQFNLSKYYKIVDVFKGTELSDMNDLSKIDFLIVDPDPYPREELQDILDKLKLNHESKIIALTSQPEDELKQTFHCKHVITKPFEYNSLLQAIED